MLEAGIFNNNMANISNKIHLVLLEASIYFIPKKRSTILLWQFIAKCSLVLLAISMCNVDYT